MIRMLAVVCCALFLSLAGCSGDGGRAQYETAQLEEQQQNMEHAVKLYREIVSRYPDSPYAAKAAERLERLGKR